MEVTLGKIKIFIYWLGNEKIKQDLIKKSRYLMSKFENISIHIGPTKEEHQFLIDNFKFYNHNFSIKRYSFCSDLYRIWILNNDNGLYMDASMIINENRFNEFLELIYKKDNLFIKENGYLIWNGLLFTNNNYIFKDILFFYKNYDKFANWFTGPMIMTMHVDKFLFKDNSNKNVFLDARDIDPFSDNSFFRYNGFGSWGKKSLVDFDNPMLSGGHKYFHKNAINFSSNKYDKKIYKFIRWWIKNYFVIFYPYIKIKSYFLNKRK